MAGVKGRSGGRRKGSGRKPFVPTDEQRRVVEMAAGFGLIFSQIVQLIINPRTKEPIGQATLLREFKAELDRGHPKALLAVAGSLYNNAVKHNNVTAQIFYLKTRGKWEDPAINVNATVAHTGSGLGDSGEALVAAINRLRVDGRADESGDSESDGRTMH